MLPSLDGQVHEVHYLHSSFIANTITEQPHPCALAQLTGLVHEAHAYGQHYHTATHKHAKTRPPSELTGPAHEVHYLRFSPPTLLQNTHTHTLSK